jgi:transposase InsO family protein
MSSSWRNWGKKYPRPLPMEFIVPLRHERFHKTVLDEFYHVAFRRKVYTSFQELQDDLDIWIKEYNEERTHCGKYC